jgi:hypothetical protein
VRRIVSSLSPEKQRVLAYKSEGKSILEMAALMGKSKDEIREIYDQARRAIVDRVVAAGIDTTIYCGEAEIMKLLSPEPSSQLELFFD